MNISELISTLTNGSYTPFLRFSHMWLENHELRISLKPTLSGAEIQPVSILISFEGEILKLTGRESPELIGQFLELTSLSEDKNYIFDSEFIHHGSGILGQVLNGVVNLFEDYPQVISFPETRSAGKLVHPIENPEFAIFFKGLLQNATENFHTFHWFTGQIFTHELHITDGRFKLYITLSGLYEYKLRISVTRENQNVVFLTLRNKQALRIFSVLKEIENSTVSNLSKVLIMLTHEVSNIDSLEEINQTVEAVISFDGKRGRPSGVHSFFFNFQTNQVTCSNTRNRRYIPGLLRELNDKINRNDTYLEILFLKRTI